MRGAASGYRPTAVRPVAQCSPTAEASSLTATPALTTTGLQRESACRADEIAQRNQQSGQTLTLRQYVERDWALRRDNNRSAPQRCKVLGGSIEGNTALVVFEADLNGRRQRGTATVQLTSKAWKVRDHGDWAPVK